MQCVVDALSGRVFNSSIAGLRKDRLERKEDPQTIELRRLGFGAQDFSHHRQPDSLCWLQIFADIHKDLRWQCLETGFARRDGIGFRSFKRDVVSFFVQLLCLAITVTRRIASEVDRPWKLV